MDSIRIDTGIKRIAINDDPERVIEFNPTDVEWSRRLDKLRFEVKKRLDEIEAQVRVLENQAQSNDDPEVSEKINNIRIEVCVYVRGLIDKQFGEGTSEKVFGDLNSEFAIQSFLVAITPYMQIAREPIVGKYQPPTRRRHAPK
jgi:hypothetical protein